MDFGSQSEINLGQQCKWFHINNEPFDIFSEETKTLGYSNTLTFDLFPPVGIISKYVLHEKRKKYMFMIWCKNLTYLLAYVNRFYLTLWHQGPLFRAVYITSGQGQKTRLDDFFTASICIFFKWDEIRRSEGMISLPPFWICNCTAHK